MSKSWKSNKKLSLLVAGALTFGIVAGVAPSQASAMTLSQSGDTYYIDGVATKYTDFVATVKAEAAKDNATISMSSSIATALSGDDLKLGKGTTLSVDGNTNSAEIVGGSAASTVSVNGTNVKGDNVNLKSIAMSATGKTAKLGVTGTVDSLAVKGGNVIKDSAGTLNVGTLDATNTNLTVSAGTLSAEEATLGAGTTLDTGSSASLEADTVTVESGATVASGSTVKADTIVAMDATAVQALLSNAKVISKSSGGTVTVDTSALSKEDQATVATAAETAAKKSGATIKATTVATSIAATGNSDGTYTIGDKTVSKDKVANTIATAYNAGTNKVTIDKATAKALAENAVTVPAGRTMVISDDENTVSATAADEDATVKVDGTTISAADDAKTPKFTNITIDTPSKTVTNNLSGIEADSVTVKAGSAVKTTDVTAKNLTLETGANITGANGTAADVKADTITVSDVSQLTGVTIAPATGSSVKIAKADGTEFSSDELETVKKVAASGTSVSCVDAKGNAQSVTGSTSAEVTKNSDGTYTVNGKKVAASDLQSAVEKLFENKDVVTLDADTANALSSVKVPAGKTIKVTDSKNGGSFSATPKADTTVTIDGNTISAADGTAFSDITVNAPGRTIVNNVKGLTADTLTVAAGAIKTGDFTATTLTITGGTITGINGAKPTANVKNVQIDPANGALLKTIKLPSTVNYLSASGALLSEVELKTLAANAEYAVGTQLTSTKDGKTTTYTVKDESAEEAAKKEAATTKAKAEKAEILAEATVESLNKIDPFHGAGALPTLESIEKDVKAFNANPTNGYSKDVLGVTISDEELATLKANLVKSYRTSESTKSLASTSLAAARATTVMSSLFADGVADRTSDLREGTPASALAGEDGSDTVWVAIKGGKTDVDNDNYDESTVRLVTYQAGYDFQVGPNDYLGLFLGSASGSVDPNSKYGSNIDIEHAFNGGVYGTHSFANNQYIDYMLEGGQFDNKANGKTWGTSNFGGALGYGIKIAQNDNLTINPYIRFKYDRISTDDYTTAPGNLVKSDDTNAFSGKLGVNFLTNYGLYGGLAYSRGFSGSYDAYINGIAMPSDDFDSNVIYLNLGYRGTLNDNTLYNVNLEKTFVDYDGWSALGRLDFKF